MNNILTKVLAYLVLVSALGMWFAGCQAIDKHQVYYPDGTLKREWYSYPLSMDASEKGHKQRQILHGTLRNWYSNGSRKSRIEYKDGQRHGVEKNWYLNRSIHSLKKYHKGLLIGEKHWSPSGEPWLNKEYVLKESSYKESGSIQSRFTVDTTGGNTRKHGKYLSWYPDGKIKTLGKYLRGEPHGFFHEWYQNGKRYSSGKYYYGKKEGIWSYWNADGQLAQKVPYQKHRKTGVLTTYYPTGRVESKQQVWQSKLHGLQKHWYQDGKTRAEIRWFKGQKHGLSRNWYPSGRLKTKIPYKLDKVHGEMEAFYPSGKKLIQADYREGKKHGTYKWWAPEGTLINQMEYQRGQKTFDVASAQIQTALRTENANFPTSFLNFYWGMSSTEVRANLFLLRGKVIHRTNEFIHASLPASKERSHLPTIIRLHFTSKGKLWEIEAHYKPSTAGNFANVSKVVEDELGTHLGITKITPSEDKLPSILSKDREWGSYLLQQHKKSTVDIYPVLRVEVFTYKERNDISVLLQNFWYRDQHRGSLSGPYYEAL
jgi:antitoxin component YwqK of YwqJK toxin-antitoxin module